ncbi:MAG: 3-hydroxyacyl-CoA dehydrogenase family protein [Salinirussus sp.]
MDLAVLGAGAFGRDLAQVLARGGATVALHDADATAVMDAVDTIDRRLEDKGDAARVDATTDRTAAVADTDFVFVTVQEDATARRERLASLEEVMDPETVIAVTDSDGGITVAAAALQHPERAIALCIPDPISASIVEVIVADQTSTAILDRVESLFADLQLPTAVVRDHPGIVSTRLALSAEVEAMRAYADGIASVPDIDDAFAQRYNHPVGPLERADRAGLDDRLETLDTLADTLGDRFAPPRILRELVDNGQLGRASGAGFYEWTDGEPAGGAVPDPELIEGGTQRGDPGR